MSFDQPTLFSAGATEMPMIFTPRLSNSALIDAMYPSSVVHTGVTARGCENSTPHESPSHSWKLIVPSVVSASKSGAVSPIVRAIVSLLLKGGLDLGSLPARVRTAEGDAWQVHGELRAGTATLRGMRVMASGLPHPMWNN